ncbi:hypothetical protein EDB87DRAFT_1684409 [Lactarius vividus]|nr:hypothetical protein EDB87DRAFT_1684409 [Lactarius vividus]
MHASHVAILVLAASAASPALSAPLAPNPFQSVPTTNSLSSGGLSIADLNNINIVNKPDSSPVPPVGARSTVDDIATKVLQLFSGNIVTRDLGDSFQSVGARSIVDDVLNTISGLFGEGDPGVLLGRDGVDLVREILRRQCGTSVLAGNQTFAPPVGACDGFILSQEAKNIQFDPNTIPNLKREAGDLSAILERFVARRLLDSLN